MVVAFACVDVPRGPVQRSVERQSNHSLSRQIFQGNEDMVASMAAGELKLNFGSGTSGLPGWVNIDNSPTILLVRLPWGRKIFRTPDWPRDVRRMDVRNPFPDSSRRDSRLRSPRNESSADVRWRSLTHLLKEAGFASPEVSSFGTSRIPEVVKLHLEVRPRDSLYVEAVR